MTDRLVTLLANPKYKGWLQEQETLDFVKELHEMSEDIRWQWANRAFEDTNPHVWVTKNSMGLAQLDMVESIIKAFYLGGDEDGEQVGAEGEVGPGAGGAVQGTGEGG